ncbi:hypothetical protein ACNO5E_16340 [Vibrio parahaemolyticus]|uniref:hypothetical protein n=1 Tax=Vibrio parahaemolyticus TaxID=670 RepID=UPI0011125A45|nr:hypothetical protein [Vibrio parahaemolyticus]
MIYRNYQAFNKVISTSVLTFGLLGSASSHAFSPELQAAVFNAAMTAVDHKVAEQLRSNTTYLRNTLDNYEALVLTQHSKLKIGTYLFLPAKWKQLTLNKALLLRGVELEFIEPELRSAGVDINLFNLPISEFSSLANPLVESCSKVTNPLTSSNVNVLFDILSSLEKVLVDKGDANAALAMIVFLKSYALIQMHDPLMTHAYVTPKCVSDLEGFISCADGFYENRSNEDQSLLSYRLKQIEDKVISNPLTQKMGNNASVHLLSKCLVPMKYFSKTAGMINPLNDDQIVKLSEILYNSNEVDLIRSQSVDTAALMKKNMQLVDFIYDFPKYVQKSNLKGSSDELKSMRNDFVRDKYYQQLEAATINVKVMLMNSPSLRPVKG